MKVRTDGSRIDTQNIGRNQSEKARKEIEQSFGLKRAGDNKQRQHYRIKPVNFQKIQYGRSDTKRAITNILDAVLKDYKYTSLPELNAILKQYNVMADRGSENSRIFQNRGLVYRILDEHGHKVGVPVKASDFYSKPTLGYLEGKFAPNESARQSYKARIKNTIDVTFLKRPGIQLQDLIKTLDKEGIQTVLRQNEDGIIYGVTYVDNHTKCVFNGSALGKPYSAKGILERCGAVKETLYNSRTLLNKLVILHPQLKNKQISRQAIRTRMRLTCWKHCFSPNMLPGMYLMACREKAGRKRKSELQNVYNFLKH